MHINIAKPVITQAEVNQAFLREIRTGFELERAMESKRLEAARRDAQEHKQHKTLPGLGKAVSCIPDRDFFRLVQKYGLKTVNSKEFIRDLHRLVPDTKVANV